MTKKLLQLVCLQLDPDGLKMSQYIDGEYIESAVVVFDEKATDKQVLESIEDFRLNGRKSLGL